MKHKVLYNYSVILFYWTVYLYNSKYGEMVDYSSNICKNNKDDRMEINFPLEFFI